MKKYYLSNSLFNIFNNNIKYIVIFLFINLYLIDYYKKTVDSNYNYIFLYF